MVKDEVDIIASTLLHMVEQGVDWLIVADNCSTDGTPDVIRDLGLPVTLVHDPEVGYYQAEKMTSLARVAECDWVVPFDADERWVGADGGTIRSVLEDAQADTVAAQSYEYVGGWEWRRPEPKRLPKVAFRYRPDIRVHQGNHGVTPMGTVTDGLRVNEWQYRSYEHLVRKARNGKAAYDATNLPASEGAHWRRLGSMTDLELHAEWVCLSDPSDLVWDPC